MKVEFDEALKIVAHAWCFITHGPHMSPLAIARESEAKIRAGGCIIWK